MIDELRADGGYVLECVPPQIGQHRHIEIAFVGSGNRGFVVTDMNQETVVGEMSQELCHAKAAGCLVVGAFDPQVVKELVDGEGLWSAACGEFLADGVMAGGGIFDVEEVPGELDKLEP